MSADAAISSSDASVPIVRLRGHTILCLQGFRGEGYSPEFVANLGAVHRRLAEHPDQLVEVLDSPDVICAACPHRQPVGCTLNGKDSEAEMRAQDRQVIALLGLTAGQRLPWGDILDRIRASVRGDDLPGICGTCRWLPLGYCRDGINRLRDRTEQPGPVLMTPERFRNGRPSPS